MSKVVILGVFVADLAFRAVRMPRMGETLIGSSFKIGPGGKGSNQAVAAARAGAEVTFITCLGDDTFADMAVRTWKNEGINPVVGRSDTATGAAHIFINEKSGDNAIIVVPGAADSMGAVHAEAAAAAAAIRAADVFVTQLEQPLEAALRGLQLAREAGVTTVLNSAPVTGPLPDEVYKLCDYVSPNESEAKGLTGFSVSDATGARRAADHFLDRGAGSALLTLGEQGALLHTRGASEIVEAFNAGKVVETTGAGDSFTGAFATALAEGLEPLLAVRFGCAAAGLSVTRSGTAPAMPLRAEIDDLLSAD